jgi:hypothetical protein
MRNDRAHLSSSPARLLLAEDDGDLRTLLALKLQDAGFEVTEACDGKVLLERLIDAPEDGGADPFDISCLTSTCPTSTPWTWWLAHAAVLQPPRSF